uniref:regulator of G-protein signaling 7-binding protein-like isoform X2 n=1 Tax=Myxine glutinosa TaxID=7769 RepID=UPI00358FE1AD
MPVPRASRSARFRGRASLGGHGGLGGTRRHARGAPRLDTCQTLVEEFHGRVALFRELVMCVGDGRSDGTPRRVALRRLRGESGALASEACGALGALALLARAEEGELPWELCKLYVQLHGAMEMYISEMLKAKYLLQTFHVQAAETQQRPGSRMGVRKGPKEPQTVNHKELSAASPPCSRHQMGMQVCWSTTLDIQNTERDISEMKALLDKLSEGMPTSLKNQDDSNPLGPLPSFPTPQHRKQNTLGFCCADNS